MNQHGMVTIDENGIDEEEPELAAGSLRAGYKRHSLKSETETNITVAIDDFMRSPASAPRIKAFAASNDSQISHVSAN